MNLFASKGLSVPVVLKLLKKKMLQNIGMFNTQQIPFSILNNILHWDYI